MVESQSTVTDLLRDWNAGNRETLDRLMPLISAELRKIARRYLERERFGHTLQPTALVHECYLRLVDRKRANWRDRTHFFAFAAKTMRRILVDHARAQGAAKRGSGAVRLPLDEALDRPEPGEDLDLLALDDALSDLARLNERQSQVLELRFFAGLSIRETAEVLDIAVATVNRDWASAKAWLYLQLQG